MSLQLQNTLAMFVHLAVELSVLFLGISLLVGMLQRHIPMKMIEAALSSSRKRSYLLAAALGAITPFCSCSTIPMLKGLIRARAGFGPMMVFLFTSPLLNPVVVVLLMATFGATLTIIYVAAALGVALTAGWALQALGFDRHVRAQTARTSSACGSSAGCGPSSNHDATPASTPGARPDTTCTQTRARTSASAASAASATSAASAASAAAASAAAASVPMYKIASAEMVCCSTGSPMAREPGQPGRQAAALPSAAASASRWLAGALRMLATGRKRYHGLWQETWGDFIDVLPYLLVGVVIGALIYGFMPISLLERYAGPSNPLSIPVAAIIGIPLYVRAEAAIPLAAGLMAKGAGAGTVLALVIGSAGASLTELILLRALFDSKLVAAFVTVVLTTAIIAGYLAFIFY